MGKYSMFIDGLMTLAALKQSAVVCVANVHMFVEAQQNEEFRKIINEAEVVTPDGKPLTWALRLLYNVEQDRVAGMDLLPDLLQKMEQEGLSVYFYGGSQKMLDSTSDYIKTTYPALTMAGSYSPPFRPLTQTEKEEIIDDINLSEPNVVFVILGCPKQENWMASVKGRVHALMIGVGGALPVMIGQQKRAPAWMQNAGLEWLYRLMQEPKRLFKRYALTNSIFIWVIIKEFIKLKLIAPLKLPRA